MAEIFVDAKGTVYGTAVRNSGFEPQGLQQDQAPQPPAEKPVELAAPIPPLVLDAPAEQPVLAEHVEEQNLPEDLEDLGPIVPAQPVSYVVTPDGGVVTSIEAEGTSIADLAAPKGTPQ